MFFKVQWRAAIETQPYKFHTYSAPYVYLINSQPAVILNRYEDLLI